MRLKCVAFLPITTRPRGSSGKCGLDGNLVPYAGAFSLRNMVTPKNGRGRWRGKTPGTPLAGGPGLTRSFPSGNLVERP